MAAGHSLPRRKIHPLPTLDGLCESRFQRHRTQSGIRIGTPQQWPELGALQEARCTSPTGRGHAGQGPMPMRGRGDARMSKERLHAVEP
eukprot:707095-Prymnesium_polylepis.1